MLATPPQQNTQVSMPRGPMLLGSGVGLGLRDLTASPSDTLSEPDSMRSSSLRGCNARDSRRRLPDLPPPNLDMTSIQWQTAANVKRRERMMRAMMDKFK